MKKRSKHEDIPLSVMKGLTANQSHDRSISTWLANTSKGQLPNMGGKERPDVSFLQEKGSTLVSGNAAKKMAIESSQGVLLS